MLPRVVMRSDMIMSLDHHFARVYRRPPVHRNPHHHPGHRGLSRRPPLRRRRLPPAAGHVVRPVVQSDAAYERHDESVGQWDVDV